MSSALSPDCFDLSGENGRLLSLDLALAGILARTQSVTGTETVPLRDALGRVLAEDQKSDLQVPPFDNSAMDGWAVALADLSAEQPVTLPVGGRIAAGHPLSDAPRPGYAYRIFTGAPVPAGLDAVIMQEQAQPAADGSAVTLPAGVKAGANIRRAGESIDIGGVPLTAGTRLQAAHLGVAATMGLTSLPVRTRLRVAIFSSGDEVHAPGTPLPPGGIYDANRTTLTALLDGLGCAVTDLGILPDQPAALIPHLTAAAADHDLIITSGGVSVGEEDHIKAAVSAVGQLHLWKLAIKPGKPLALGQVGRVPFLGLPGNPVAVMVTFLLLGKALVLRLAGATVTPPPRFEVPAAFSLRTRPGRREFPRARLRSGPFGLVCEMLPSESSGVLTSMSAADGLLDLPESGVTIAPGDPVAFLSLPGLLD